MADRGGRRGGGPWLIDSIWGLPVSRLFGATLLYTFLSLMPLLFLLQLRESQSADANSPHRHTGLLAPYEQKAPAVKLDKDALTKLSKGLPVKFQIKEGRQGGRGIVVQDVHAPVDVVMDRILDFSAYPRMVSAVTECGNYKVNKVGRDEIEYKTRFVVSVLGIKFEYFIRHLYKPSISTITWTLDYSRASDFDDSVGYWFVAPWDEEKHSEWSRVYYSIDVRVPEWIPSLVINILNTQALTQATAWVKTESEKAFKAKAKHSPPSKASTASSSLSTSQPPSKDKASPVDEEKPKKRRVWGLWQKLTKGKGKDEERGKGKIEQGEREASKGDGQRVLATLWLAVLFYSLARIWGVGRLPKRREENGEARDSSVRVNGGAH